MSSDHPRDITARLVEEELALFDEALNHAWPDLVRFGIGHVPFGNLIYLKGALDYLLWYHIYEAISPGWWERTNRRLQKEQGRTMVGYTPGGSVP
jgi:hypothetical protein